MADPEPNLPTPELNPTPDPEPLFVARTQKDLDKKFGEEKRDARTQAIKDLLEELGAESEDELKSAYEGFKTVEAETQTEADKARQEADREKKAREAAEEREKSANKLADERLIKSELRLELLSEGARKDRLPKILRDADLSEVEIENEEVKNLASVVARSKEEYPEWFGASFSALPQTPDGSGSQTPKSVAQSYMDRKYGSKEAS